MTLLFLSPQIPTPAMLTTSSVIDNIQSLRIIIYYGAAVKSILVTFSINSTDCWGCEKVALPAETVTV